MVMPNELMQGGLPPEGLAQMIGGAMAASPPDAGGPPPQEAPDELGAVQEVVQDLHTLLTVLKDPQMTQIASTCLTNMTKVQAMLMSQGGGSGAGASGSY